MADVTIWPTTISYMRNEVWRTGIYFTSPTVGYTFYLADVAGIQTFYVSKTIDGGQTFNFLAAISTAGIDVHGPDIVASWETNCPDANIYFAWAEETNNKLRFGYLNTSDDSITTVDTQVLAGNIAFAQNSITIANSGRIYIDTIGTVGGAAGSYYCNYSDDGGSIWNVCTSWHSLFAGHPDEALNRGFIYPSLYTGGSDDDIWAISSIDNDESYYLHRYDAGAASWGNTQLIIDVSPYNSERTVRPFHAILASGYLLLVLKDHTYTSSVNNIRSFIIDSAENITEKTQVSNVSLAMVPCLMRNPNTGRIYCAYADGSLSGTMRTYYKYTDDMMTTWSAQQGPMNVTIDDWKTVYPSVFNPFTGGRMMPCWPNEDLSDLVTNYTNSIQINPIPPRVGPGTLYIRRHFAHLGANI